MRTKQGDVFFCRKIVLAIGLQGNLRKLGVEGESLEGVQYQLDDPKEYEDETIVVVGAGDAAIENALALAEQNRVILINRNEEFTRCKEGNLTLILSAIKEGRVEIRLRHVGGPGGAGRRRGAAALPREEPGRPGHRSSATASSRAWAASRPRKLVEGFGVKFPSADPNAVPELSDTYESNVKGLYIVGALGGYPLIKQAMNQGYEVVESALGRMVEPADEPLLAKKFANFSRTKTVSQVLDVIQAQVPLLSGINRLQLREFLLESELHAPREGEVLFERNDYTNSFYMVVAGDVRVEGEGGKLLRRWAPASSSASWASSRAGGDRAPCAPARTASSSRRRGARCSSSSPRSRRFAARSTRPSSSARCAPISRRCCPRRSWPSWSRAASRCASTAAARCCSTRATPPTACTCCAAAR